MASRPRAKQIYMRITPLSILTMGIALLGLQSCKKTAASPVPVTNGYIYYPLTIGSTDSVNYATTYYYDPNNRITGFKTDSLDDSLFYNASNQIVLRTVNHLKPSFNPQIPLPRVDSVFFSYDNSGRIVSLISPNETTGVTHVGRGFNYNTANQIVGDTSYVLVGKTLTKSAYTTRAYDAAGNVDSISTIYLQNHYKIGSTGDSIARITTTYHYLVNHPARNNVFGVSTRIALGDFNKSPNVSTQHTTTAYKTDGTIEYSYSYTNVYSFDATSLLPISNSVASSPSAAGSGPYTLTYTYKALQLGSL